SHHSLSPRCILYLYAHHPALLSFPTRRSSDLIATGPGLLAPPDEGTTAIWDAVALTSSDVLANAPGLRRRAIILLTDGLDTTSRSEEHTSELQSRRDLVCRLLLEKKKLK